MAELVEAIRSILVPLADAQLILPNAAVAEIVDYTKPAPIADARPWLLGMLSWRLQSVPLVSLEVLHGGNCPTPSPRSRIAVCNTISGRGPLNFIGLLAVDLPRLIRIDKEAISVSNGTQASNPGILSRVQVKGEDALIPDLDELEAMVYRQIGYA